MRVPMVEQALWGVAAVSLLFATLSVRAARATPSSLAQSVPGVVSEPPRIDPDSIVRAAAYIAANNPFRLSRQPATVAYSPALEGFAPPPTVRPSRPELVLRGIVGGPPWSAILEGIPGRDGSVMARRGDSLGTLIVRAVRRDTVVIKGADTTWRLTVKRP